MNDKEFNEILDRLNKAAPMFNTMGKNYLVKEIIEDIIRNRFDHYTSDQKDLMRKRLLLTIVEDDDAESV